jgi:uncharacterized protein YjiS (DUF1127 family)
MTSLTQSGGADFRVAWRNAFAALGAALRASVHALMDMQARAQERHRLRELTPEMLKDVGLTRGDIERTLQRSDDWR